MLQRWLLLLMLFVTGFVYAAESELMSNDFENYAELANYYQQQANYYKSLSLGESSVVESSIYESQPNVESFNPFTGSQLGLGGGSATGAGENSNFSGSLVFNYNPVEGESGWGFNTIGQYDYLYTPEEGNSKNRLYLQQNGAYLFDNYNGIFAQGSYLNDKNDGYVFVFNENIGYQLQLFKNKTHSLQINLGPGLQQREIVTSNFTETQPQFLSQLTYNLNLSKILTFYEQLQNTYTKLNATTYSISQLNFLIAKGFSIGLNYQLTYNSQAVDGVNALTTISSFQFNYGIN